jgi:uncharacterized protein
MTIDAEALAVIGALGLVPHPEGGLYRETFRSPASVETPRGGRGVRRAASTAIYYLLPAGALSALHRVAADEVWHHYDGGPLELHTIDGAGSHRMARLGRDVAAGERPQIAVPAGAWQAAVCGDARFALCGCTVAPGFEFVDFEMASRDALVAAMPGLRSVVERLTRAT